MANDANSVLGGQQPGNAEVGAEMGIDMALRSQAPAPCTNQFGVLYVQVS